MAALVARGIDAMSARATALASIMGSTMRESMVLSFDRIFIYTGILLLLVLPLLLFLKTRAIGPAAEMHPE